MVPPRPINHLAQHIERLLTDSGLLNTPEKTLIILPDATRPLPVRDILPPLLTRLRTARAPTTILIGQGLHRPMTSQELRPLTDLQNDFAFDLHQHTPDRTRHLTAIDGIPISLHPLILSSPRVLCIGTVEPHQYAGFSGGSKALSIGCAGRKTIEAMHSLHFLRDENTTLGLTTTNPFRQTLDRIAHHLKTVRKTTLLGLQCLPTPGQPDTLSALSFGPLSTAFTEAVQKAKSLYFHSSFPLHATHLKVPSAKASNFYQASRAATYLALLPRTALLPGSPIFLEAPCPEGIGQGSGEQACADAMLRGPDTLLTELHTTPLPHTSGGAQRAYVLARALARNPIYLIGAPPLPPLHPFGIPQFKDLPEACQILDLATENLITLDDIFHHLPTLSTSSLPSTLPPTKPQ